MMVNRGSKMFILINTGLELDYNINILQHLYEPYIPSLFNEYWLARYICFHNLMSWYQISDNVFKCNSTRLETSWDCGLVLMLLK